MLVGTSSIINLVQQCGNDSNGSVWQEFHDRFDHQITSYVKKALRRRTKSNYARVTYSQELLSDLTQDVYVRLLENDRQALRTFKGFTESSFLAYLARISTNVVIEYFRKQLADKRNAPQVSIETLIYDDGSEGFDSCVYNYNNLNQQREDAFINKIAIRELVQLLNKNFKEKKLKRDKTVFILYSFYGLTPKQITEISELKLSYANVEAIIRRVRQRLLAEWTPASADITDRQQAA